MTERKEEKANCLVIVAQHRGCIYILLRLLFADSIIFSMAENKIPVTNVKGEFVRNSKNILILFNSSSVFRI
jgi:hypothetical protein